MSIALSPREFQAKTAGVPARRNLRMSAMTMLTIVEGHHRRHDHPFRDHEISCAMRTTVVTDAQGKLFRTDGATPRAWLRRVGVRIDDGVARDARWHAGQPGRAAAFDQAR
jgi:hypothetical protein